MPTPDPELVDAYEKEYRRLRRAEQRRQRRNLLWRGFERNFWHSLGQGVGLGVGIWIMIALYKVFG